MFTVTQHFDKTSITDVPGAVREAVASLAGIRERVKPGMSVALLVGSRGVANLPEIVKTAIECLKGIGLKPFITPCMGSHGGGAAEGQTELLKDLGVSEEPWAYTNAVSSTRFRAARLPLIVKNDKVLLETIVKSRAEPEKLSVMGVESTAELERFWITRNLAVQLEDNPKASISS